MKITKVKQHKEGYTLNDATFAPFGSPLYKNAKELINSGALVLEPILTEHEASQEEFKKIYERASNDLHFADLEICKCNEQSSRAISTIYNWYAYKEALRDIASINNGVYSVNDISEKKYIYNNVDYTCSLDAYGYPVAPK